MFQDILITITGRKNIYIENFKNILDYRDDLILIQGKKGSVKILGNDFRIDYFTSESMRIIGNISGIEFGEAPGISGRR